FYVLIFYFYQMRLSLSAVFCFFILNGFSQTITQKLERAYSILENDPQLKYGSASLTVLNGENGEVVFSRNGNTGLAPASTLKTITSATAYHLLGPDYTWKTTLGYSGSISADGTLNGNIVLTGGGDPSLGSWRYNETKPEVLLNKWVQAIRESGIKKITGRLITDDTLFGSQSLPTGWNWQDMGNYYGAGPNSLSWHENQFDLIFKPGPKTGDPAELIRTVPDMSYLKIVNEVKTGKPGSGDNVYAFSAPYSNLIYLRGTYGIDLKKTISASVPDPALELAFRLQDTLKKLNVHFSLPAVTGRALLSDNVNVLPVEKVLAVHTSPPLSQIVYWFNQKSINLYGEHLVKSIALQKGKEAETTLGVNAVKEFWNEKLKIDEDAMNVIDGSGLSSGNRITTLAMARILVSARKEPWFKSYFDSFPKFNNMKMKSGSINDVLAYTGYETSASSGTPYVFSIMINNYNGSSSAVKQKMFKVLDVLK
ncbi:MAG TPA: D-alanyl-D-alanine carboxypeptidase/D-alanyl-D-alanine-endopeptidase, partial [Daejeonella sp.]|nr:D-alanyl-D-alanine carboxypeptidase/D-alanyl-D-alanine-endopeptidase [Daejeonella sp.]